MRGDVRGDRETGGAASVETGLVFTAVDGRHVDPHAVSLDVQRLVKAAGLPPIRLHDLRHTAASLALQAGVPLKVVSEQLGHGSLAITADTYISVLPAVARAAAEASPTSWRRRPTRAPDARSAPPRTFRAESHLPKGR